MTLAVRSPRRSALGVAWCEDFSRGRLGVRKNQGQIVEAAPNVIGFQGRWARFPGSAACAIEYPHQPTGGASAFTIGCWLRNHVTTGVTQFLLGQGSSVAWDANTELYLYVNATDTMAIYFNRAGAAASALATIATLGDDELFLAATWATGDNLRIFVNGEVNNTGAVLAGTINDAQQPLTVGRRANGDVPCNGEMADPFLVFRQWSADEIRNYYRRSTFH